MKYIVYKTTNLVNGFIYVGVHGTANPEQFDMYLGNGVYINVPTSYEKAKTKFQQAVKEYGTSNFKREVIATFDTKEEAYELEGHIVNENFLARNDVYNMILGGIVNCTEGIKVFQYDENGLFLKEYPSYEVAGHELNVQPSSIRRAVVYKYRIKNTYFNTDKLNQIDLSNYTNNINKQKVYRYLKTGEFDREFESYSEAGRYSNTAPANIMQATKLGYCVKLSYYFSFIKAKSFDKARSLQISSRQVFKYNSNGEFLEEFETQQEAQLKNPHCNITKAIKLKQPDEQGNIWGLEKLKNYNKPSTPKNRKKRVAQIDDYGNILKQWDSARQCAKEVGGAVQNVLSGKYQKHKGYIYKYIDN